MKYPLDLNIGKSEQAYQRVAIATELVEDSLGSLMDMSHRVQGIQEPLEELSVVLYELKKLSQELSILLDTSTSDEPSAIRP